MSSTRTKKETELLRRIGKKIVEYTQKNGISVERLAYEAGVSKGYAYDIIKGKGNPSVLVLNKFADCLGVSLKELF